MQRFWFQPLLILTIMSLIITGQADRVVAESDGAISPSSSTTSGSTICGSKFDDANGNGIQDAGEPSLPGWTIELVNTAGNVVDTTITSTESAVSPPGRFCFQNLKDGSYTVREVAQSGWQQTFPTAPGTHSVTVGAGTSSRTLLFGNRQSTVTGTGVGSICGAKFEDTNGNGLQEDGEPGLGGWSIQITDAAGNLVATQITDRNGKYCFDRVRLDIVYTVSEVMQAGWQQTLPGGDNAYTVMLTAAASTTKPLLFGNTKVPTSSTLCGIKFNDVNGNGVQDRGELGLGGWTILALDEKGNVVAKVITRDDGTFCFEPLRPGLYTFTEVMQDGWTQTLPGGTGAYSVQLTAAQQEYKPLLFGNRQAAATICGIKFEDKNGNGRQDSGELGLTGWIIEVKDAASNWAATAVTDKAGKYCVKDLRPGEYTFAEVMQDGYQQTFPGSPFTHTVRVSVGQNTQSIDFGNQKKEDPCCLSFTFLHGRADNFGTADGAEPALPSAALVQAMPASAVYLGFDGTADNRLVAHTFTLPVGNCVESATLEFKAKPMHSNSDNDTLSLLFAGAPGTPVWGAYLGAFQPSPGLVTSNWTPPMYSTADYSAGHVFSLDLASLPGGVNLIPTLNAKRFLDFVLQDDTSVDYVRLTVEFCECDSSGPKPVEVDDNPPQVKLMPILIVRDDTLGSKQPMTLEEMFSIGSGQSSKPPLEIDEPSPSLIPSSDPDAACGDSCAEAGVNIRLVVDSREAVVNGKASRLSKPAVVHDGSTLLPFRDFGNLLGAEVEWDMAERRATYRVGDTEVEVWIGRLMARVNGKEFPLSIAPVLIDGSTYVPLRSIVQAFGLTVEYDPSDRSIKIFDRWGK